MSVVPYFRAARLAYRILQLLLRWRDEREYYMEMAGWSQCGVCANPGSRMWSGGRSRTFSVGTALCNFVSSCIDQQGTAWGNPASFWTNMALGRNYLVGSTEYTIYTLAYTRSGSAPYYGIPHYNQSNSRYPKRYPDTWPKVINDEGKAVTPQVPNWGTEPSERGEPGPAIEPNPNSGGAPGGQSQTGTRRAPGGATGRSWGEVARGGAPAVEDYSKPPPGRDREIIVTPIGPAEATIAVSAPPASRRPPARGEREKKFAGSYKAQRTIFGIVARAKEDISEIQDFIEAIFESLPKRVQKTTRKTNGRKTIQGMLETIYQNWDKIDWTQAAKNVVWEYFEDKAFRQLIKASDAASNRTGQAATTKVRGIWLHPQGTKGVHFS